MCLYKYRESNTLNILQMNLSINQDADTTLKRFQEWQYIMNPGDDSHPNHHDCAILISRYVQHRQSCWKFNLISRFTDIHPSDDDSPG